METGNGLFFPGKMGFRSLGLGFSHWEWRKCQKWEWDKYFVTIRHDQSRHHLFPGVEKSKKKVKAPCLANS